MRVRLRVKYLPILVLFCVMHLGKSSQAKQNGKDDCDDLLAVYKSEMQLDGDSILPFLDSIELDLKSNNTDCYYELLFYKGLRYEYIDEEDKLLNYFENLEKNKKYMQYPKLRAMLYSHLGYLNRHLLLKYDLAFEYYSKAKEIALEIGDYNLINRTMLANAHLYEIKNDTVKWKKTFEELFTIFNEDNQNISVEDLYYTYQEYGFGNIKYGNLDTTVKYLRLCRRLGEKNNIDDYEFFHYEYMGWAYISANKPLIGLSYLDSVTKIPPWNTTSFKAELYQYKAIGNYKIGRFGATHKYLDSMISVYDIPSVYEVFYKWKHKTYRSQGKYKLALASHENYVNYLDSNKKQEAVRNVEVVKKQIKSLKQEERIKLSEQRQNIFKKQRWLFAGGAALVGLFAFLYVRQRSKKKIKELQAEMAEVQLASLKSQMNPHFMFNSINSIKGLIINEAADAAADQLTRFSKLMRSTLNYSSESTISIQEEIEFINLYAELERFKGKFPTQINFEIHPSIDPEETKVIPFLIQPFVENAFKHAFHEMNDRRPQIDIRFKKADGALLIEIQDNGIGVKNESATTHISKGTSLVEKRLELHNKKKNNVSITFRGENQGTIVTLQIRN